MIELLRLTDNEILQIVQSSITENTLQGAGNSGVRVSCAFSRISQRNMVNLSNARGYAAPAAQVIMGPDDAVAAQFAGAPYYIGYIQQSVLVNSGVVAGDSFEIQYSISNGANLAANIVVTRNGIQVAGFAAGINPLLINEAVPFPIVFQSLKGTMVSAAGNMGYRNKFIGLQVFVN